MISIENIEPNVSYDKNIDLNEYLGRGHGHSFSSSTYFTTTSLNRWSIEVTAILLTIPILWSGVKSFPRDCMKSPGFPFGPKNENCSNVSKQVRANSSRNFLVDSVSFVQKLIQKLNKLTKKQILYKILTDRWTISRWMNWSLIEQRNYL